MTTDVELKAQRLMELSRGADEPSAAQLLSLHGAVAAGIAAEGAGAAAGVASSVKTASASALVKGLVAAGAIASGAAGFFSLQATPAALPAPQVAAHVAPARPAPLSLELPPAPAASAATPAPSSASVRVSKSSVGLRLQDEAALLADVQGALRAGRAGAALALLGNYDRRFPTGMLRSEAEAARVFAWCAAGRVDKARAFAERFVQRYPNAPATSRVQNACK